MHAHRYWLHWITTYLMRHLLRVQQSPPGYPPSRLLIIVDGQLIGSPACSAALALLVIFRRTRVLRKCRKGECPGGIETSVRSKGASIHSTVYWCCQQKASTTCITVERVEAECTKFVTHSSQWRKKLCGLNKKIGCHGIVPWGMERLTSDLSSAAKLLPNQQIS